MIVGSATFPELGNNADIGSAMSITRATAEQIGAPEYGAAALIDLAPGTSPAVLGDYSRSGELITPFRVARVRNLEQVGMLPFLLAAFAASVGLLAVGHGLWVSINARRRDLAVLATLGFRPQDIRTMLLWQATFIAIVGTLLGVTVGIILGTNAWSAVASSTAVIDQAVVPGVALVLIVGGTFLGCNLIALVAARGTRRTGTAQALQGE